MILNRRIWYIAIINATLLALFEPSIGGGYKAIY